MKSFLLLISNSMMAGQYHSGSLQVERRRRRRKRRCNQQLQQLK
jgi:hypothetical protein